MLLMIGSVGAHATQQYFTVTGTYGNITVTTPGCPAAVPTNGIGGRNGFALVSNQTCTLTFSPPISVGSLTIDIDVNNLGDSSTFSLNSTPYTPVPGDLTVLSGAHSPGLLTITGPSLGGNGSATLRFTNSPPAAVTQLTIAYTFSSGTFFRVGFDDAVAVSAVPVPTLSPWAMVALAIGFCLVFFRLSKLVSC